MHPTATIQFFTTFPPAAPPISLLLVLHKVGEWGVGGTIYQKAINWGIMELHVITLLNQYTR